MTGKPYSSFPWTCGLRWPWTRAPIWKPGSCQYWGMRHQKCKQHRPSSRCSSRPNQSEHEMSKAHSMRSGTNARRWAGCAGHHLLRRGVRLLSIWCGVANTAHVIVSYPRFPWVDPRLQYRRARWGIKMAIVPGWASIRKGKVPVWSDQAQLSSHLLSYRDSKVTAEDVKLNRVKWRARR